MKAAATSRATRPFSLPTLPAPAALGAWAVALFFAVFAGAAPAIITAGALAGVFFAVALFKKPVIGAYALVLSVPIQQAIELPGGTTVTQVLFVAVLGIWWFWLALRDDRRVVMPPVAVALVFFLVSTLASLWVTTSLPESLAEISRWLVTILSFVIIVNSVQTRREMNVLIAVMLAAGLSEALLGLVQAYSGFGPASFNVDGILTRAYGTIGAPNSFAGYINMSVPLAFALALYFWGKWFAGRKSGNTGSLRAPTFMTAVALILFWTMLTTLSRGAWIGLAFGVLVMVLALGHRARGAIAILLGAIIALLLLAELDALPPAVSERFGLLVTQLTIFDPRGVTPTPENYALVERMVHWQVAGNMFLSSPWIGVGIGNFNVLFDKFGVQGWPYSRGHAHNYYLHLLAEVGIVGLIFYLIMLTTAFTAGVRALRRVRINGDTFGEAVVIGALGILTTFSMHNFFENLHALNMGIHWAAALALFTLVWLRPSGQSRQRGTD